MNDLLMHDDIDRLDTGISQTPDVFGIISAARRRRRRTRAIWTAGGLATAAVVAPLAILVGGTITPAPPSSGFASAPSSDPLDEITAAVTEGGPELPPSSSGRPTTVRSGMTPGTTTRSAASFATRPAARYSTAASTSSLGACSTTSRAWPASG